MLLFPCFWVTKYQLVTEIQGDLPLKPGLLTTPKMAAHAHINLNENLVAVTNLLVLGQLA